MFCTGLHEQAVNKDNRLGRKDSVTGIEYDYRVGGIEMEGPGKDTAILD